jgi:hypothetical protein
MIAAVPAAIVAAIVFGVYAYRYDAGDESNPGS